MAFERLAADRAPLATTSLVLVETYALLGRRLGLDHLLARKKSRLSLVDAASFLVMRQRGIQRAFAYDPHYEEEGFSLVTS